MSELFEVEHDGTITTVRFQPADRLLPTKLRDRDEVLRALRNARRTSQKVLIFEFPEDGLGPNAMEKLAEDGVARFAEKLSWQKEEDLPLLLRVRFFFEEVIQFAHAARTVSVASFDGAVDFDLLGLLLACDYRICSEKTTLVNRVLDRRMSPGNALVWYLTRSVGDSRAMGLLLEGRPVPASEALELGLVNRVVPAMDLAHEARTMANRLAAAPADAIHTLLNARAAANADLKRYLKDFGVGFKRLPGREAP